MIEITFYHGVCEEYAEAGRVVRGGEMRLRLRIVGPRRPLAFWINPPPLGEKWPIPAGYGLAWRDVAWRRALFAVMPLNILIGLALRWYDWMEYRFGSRERKA